MSTSAITRNSGHTHHDLPGQQSLEKTSLGTAACSVWSEGPCGMHVSEEIVDNVNSNNL